MRFWLTMITALALVAGGLGTAGARAAVGAAGGMDYVLLVDNTGTMTYQGRGDATIEALRLVADLAQPGDRVTVYSFGEKAVPVLSGRTLTIAGPPSQEELRAQVAFSFDANRTDITAGVELAWTDREAIFQKLAGTASSNRPAAVVLLTDGKLVPVYDDYAKYDSIYHASRKRLRELASLFGQAGIPIHTVGLGSAKRIDGDLLDDIARRSGGTYHHVPRSDDLVRTYGDIMAAMRGASTAAA